MQAPSFSVETTMGMGLRRWRFELGDQGFERCRAGAFEGGAVEEDGDVGVRARAAGIRAMPVAGVPEAEAGEGFGGESTSEPLTAVLGRSRARLAPSPREGEGGDGAASA